MKIVDFKKPETLNEAHSMISEPDKKTVIMAGGTSFQFLSEDSEKTAVDINSVLPKGISAKNNNFTIGAATNIVELQEYSAQGWVLNNVAVKLSTQQIRNMSTLGGNIARVFPWSDFPVALLAVNAEISVNNGSEKTYSSEDFFNQQPAHLLKNNVLITSVQVPIVSEGSGFGYHKEVRTTGGFSTLTVAAYLKCDNNIITEVNLAAGAALGLPVRLKAIEEALIGKLAEFSSFEEAVPSLINKYPWKGKEGASNEYAVHLAETIIIDVLKESLLHAKGGIK